MVMANQRRLRKKNEASPGSLGFVFFMHVISMSPRRVYPGTSFSMRILCHYTSTQYRGSITERISQITLQTQQPLNHTKSNYP